MMSNLSDKQTDQWRDWLTGEMDSAVDTDQVRATVAPLPITQKAIRPPMNVFNGCKNV